MSPVWHPNPLPFRLDLSEIESWARPFAPKLFFHSQERHFPSDPERFSDVSRFREARQGARDRGWNKEEQKWRTGNAMGPAYYDAPWSDVATDVASRTGEDVRLDPAVRGTLRPHGERNLNRPSGRPGNGLFLERDGVPERDHSGNQPVAGAVHAPVFVDVAGSSSSDGDVLKVLFWFFYELNQWHGLLTHEGDWEHVTYLVPLEDFRGAKPPTHVYFAQHNSGDLRRFELIPAFDDTHPHMFVDRHGHPTRAAVSFPEDYPSVWNTWEQEWRWVRNENWREFSGAWGEVGETRHTTGPLGPWFKQFADRVRVRRDESGKLLIFLP